MTSIAENPARWLDSLHRPTTEIIWSMVLGVCALGLYLSSLAPSITWENNTADSGELASAVVTGGIAHPTGYPLYLLLGRLAVALPLGEPAFALNTFSAICAAAALSVIATLVSRAAGHAGLSLPVSLAGATLAAVAIGLSPVLWTQATVTETRALAALLMAITLLCAFEVYTRNLHPATAAFVFGLACSDHLMTLALLPALMLLCAQAVVRRGGAAAAWTLLALLAGLLPYLYLPVRAVAQPSVNWGDPATPGRFIALVSGAQYRDEVGWGDIGFLTSMQSTLTTIRDQVGWVIVALAVIGWLTGARGALRWILALCSICLASASIAASYQDQAASYYVLPAVMALGVSAGIGLAMAGQAIIKPELLWPPHLPHSTIRAVLCGISAVLVIWNCGWQWQQSTLLVSAADDTMPRTFGTQTLAALLPGGVVLVDGDQYTFALMYAHDALRIRPDVAIVNATLLQYRWYAEQAARRLGLSGAERQRLLAAGAALTGYDLAVARVTVLATLVAPRRPLYMKPESPALASLCDEVEDGILFRCVPRSS